MKPKVYVETSIISYLTAQPSRDLVTAARQQLTREWWENQRRRFDLFISSFVFTEACLGDDRAAAFRIAALHGISMVELNPVAMRLGEQFLEKGALPRRATIDALQRRL